MYSAKLDILHITKAYLSYAVSTAGECGMVGGMKLNTSHAYNRYERDTREDEKGEFVVHSMFFINAPIKLTSPGNKKFA